jgi:hypothetical protein
MINWILSSKLLYLPLVRGVMTVHELANIYDMPQLTPHENIQ